MGINAVWQSLHNKRNPTTIAQLKDNFGGFQRQSVLEAVTPVSLFKLIRDTVIRNQITFVAWNRETLRFTVK